MSERENRFKIMEQLKKCLINIGDDMGVHILVKEEEVNETLDYAMMCMEEITVLANKCNELAVENMNYRETIRDINVVLEDLKLRGLIDDDRD